MIPKFLGGRLLATPNALQSIPEPELKTALVRHFQCDWGEVDEHDRRENDISLTRALRLFSKYTTTTGTKFWIITEADRSVTTVLLPEDY